MTDKTAQQRIDDAAIHFITARSLRSKAKSCFRDAQAILKDFPICEGKFINSDGTLVIQISEHEFLTEFELDEIDELDNA